MKIKCISVLEQVWNLEIVPHFRSCDQIMTFQLSNIQCDLTLWLARAPLGWWKSCMVQACLPAVPRIKTVTDGLGSENTDTPPSVSHSSTRNGICAFRPTHFAHCQAAAPALPGWRSCPGQSSGSCWLLWSLTWRSGSGCLRSAGCRWTPAHWETGRPPTPAWYWGIKKWPSTTKYIWRVNRLKSDHWRKKTKLKRIFREIREKQLWSVCFEADL